MEQNNWFYKINGQKIGPVTENNIIEMIKAGTLNANDQIWNSEFTKWFSVKETHLCIHLSSSPSNETDYKKIDNTIVWVLAFAPLVGGMIDLITGLWISTLAINIALSYVDENKLKKQGVDTAQFGAAWLVPVYLYKRAKELKQEPIYFIVWIVTFVISLLLPEIFGEFYF